MSQFPVFAGAFSDDTRRLRPSRAARFFIRLTACGVHRAPITTQRTAATP